MNFYVALPIKQRCIRKYNYHIFRTNLLYGCSRILPLLEMSQKIQRKKWTLPTLSVSLSEVETIRMRDMFEKIYKKKYPQRSSLINASIGIILDYIVMTCVKCFIIYQ